MTPYTSPNSGSPVYIDNIEIRMQNVGVGCPSGSVCGGVILNYAGLCGPLTPLPIMMNPVCNACSATSTNIQITASGGGILIQ